MLPRKLKWILRKEFWGPFETLLVQGTEVYKGYVDDPRNTDNAWIETVAVSIHFQDQNDLELKRLEENLYTYGPKESTCDLQMSTEWQVVDRRIPLYSNHKTILQKVALLFGAHF